MRKWLGFPLSLVLVLLFGCSANEASNSLEGTGQQSSASSGAGQASGIFAVPQEELQKTQNAITVSGTITVKDYTSGLLQIDVTKSTGGKEPTQGVPPITVARFKTPGPFEMLLPPNASEVNFSLILDLKGNGPDAEDPKVAYDKNPVTVSGSEVSGIDLVIEKLAVDLPPEAEPPPANMAPPPTPEETKSTDAAASEKKPEVDALSLTASSAEEVAPAVDVPRAPVQPEAGEKSGQAEAGDEGKQADDAQGDEKSAESGSNSDDPLDESND